MEISQNFVAFTEYMNFKVEKQKSKGRNKKKMTCLYLHDLMLNEKSNAGTQPFIPKWSH